MFFIGIIMLFWPGGKSNGAIFRQIIGFIFSFIGLLTWTGSLAVKHYDQLFYETSKGPVYKVFKINTDKSCTFVHDTVTIYVKDSISDIKSDTAKIIHIPFKKSSSGHMQIRIKIGQSEYDAIYDTGFDGFISFDIKTYYKLVGAGVTEEDKFIGTTDYIIGDGSVITENNFILSHVEIGDFSIDNIKVGVGDGDMILVGNLMFKNYKSYSIDQENNKIILTR